ncbi:MULTISPECIES: lipoprotein [unclassified Streptomyces]|uniref:lipoprotein n=1 Tax=unclassified Streptomyces TaxID=2593676 RepID=UPI003D71CF03
MWCGAGNAVRGLAAAACAAGLLTGCGQGGGEGEARASGTPSASASASGEKAARAVGSVGGAGSACELPVTFALAERWHPDAVSLGADADPPLDEEVAEEVAALARQGYVTLACELDAKPAGHIGFLRVYTGEPGDADARQVLEAFLRAEDGVEEAEYRSFRSGPLSGTEVQYRHTVEVLDETRTERALAVVAPDGPVVLQLGGLDDEEHRDMLPAYELAKQTLRVTARR